MSDHLSEAQVHLFQDAYHPEPMQTLSLADVIRWIHQGRYRSEVRHVRRVLAEAGELAYRRAKNTLHAVTFAGTFAPSRKNESLHQHSGIVHGDLDHLRDLPDCKRAIASDPRTVYVFTSPRADGLKVGVHIPIVPDDQAYKHAWHAVSAEYAHRYGGEWDRNGACTANRWSMGCTGWTKVLYWISSSTSCRRWGGST